MDNHAHLVIKELEEPISFIMKRIGISYATYFNKKYKRVGHVFQDRFKSEPIENERYLLSAIRYIHNNPVKAGICKIQEYKWSSYQFYIQEAKGQKKLQEVKEQKKLVEREEILSRFSEDRDRAIILFKEFNNQDSDDDFIDIEDDMLDEEGTIAYIKDYLFKRNISFEYLKQKKYNRERDILVHNDDICYNM